MRHADPQVLTIPPDFLGLGDLLQGDLVPVVIEVLGAVVADVLHAHGGCKVGVPGGWEVHGQRQISRTCRAELLLQNAEGAIEQPGHNGGVRIWPPPHEPR